MARPPKTLRPPKKAGPRSNQDISVSQVRLINANGDNVGLVNIDEALRQAKAAGLDLVEISPNAEPPVCKILDLGRFRYEEKKRKSEAKKKQKTVEIKEIKIRPNIEDHDYQVKLKAAKKFLTAGNKVKVTLRFRGREMAHQSHGFDVVKRIQEDLASLSKVEAAPKLEGRQVLMVLGPIT